MIIYIFIIIMASMISAISYFYVVNTYDDFNLQMQKFIDEYYSEKKGALKKEIQTVVDILNYNLAKDVTQDELKEEAVRLLNNINFEANKSNYFFVYEIENLNGGGNFAKLIVNPNRPDLVGKYISTNFVDDNGKKFREDFLRDIRNKGESFTQYAYKKPTANDQVRQKLSYFKYFKEWKWVIAVGIYVDDIEKEISVKKDDLKSRVKKQVAQNVVLFLMFLSIAILFSFAISKKIEDVLKEYENKVSQNAKELEELNKNLENRIKEAIERNRENEQLLVQKSKFISLGEMISNIAHQWRQPLSELSSILMFIKIKYKMGSLDEKLAEEKFVEANKVIDFMSHTIDDFRNFFMPKKEKEEFLLMKVVESVMTIVSSTLQNNNIELFFEIPEDIKLKTYLNEYTQVILNIIKNAQDVLIEKKIENPFIKISAKEEGEYIVLCIEDNGGGITVEPKGKIFEPYFTTKDDSNGTGIGLYMSKIIVDKNMKGKLRVRNTKNGAKFAVSIPKN